MDSVMCSSGTSKQLQLRTTDLDLFRERLLCKEREGTRLGKDRFKYSGECLQCEWACSCWLWDPALLYLYSWWLCFQPSTTSLSFGSKHDLGPVSPFKKPAPFLLLQLNLHFNLLFKEIDCCYQPFRSVSYLNNHNSILALSNRGSFPLAESLEGSYFVGVKSSQFWSHTNLSLSLSSIACHDPRQLTWLL